MLSPKKVKYRKEQKKSAALYGVETRGTSIAFGQYALRALEPAWIENRQIEAARIAITRCVKRGGKVWIRVFPWKPLSKKPAEVRMGKGKGSPEKWVAPVRAGKILFEITGVDDELARQALDRAAAKLPVRCRVEALSHTILPIKRG